MGDRANYIIKTENGTDIYYTHWRSPKIAQDMALGYEKLKSFIGQFEKRDMPTPHPWIEACILIDEPGRSVIFWECSWLTQTSVRVAYVKMLRDIWKGWDVRYAEREMYDIEPKIGINYIQNQDEDFYYSTIEKLKEDINDEEFLSWVTIKELDKLKIWYIGCLYDDDVVLLGEEIIPALQQEKESTFLKEIEVDVCGLAIDLDRKKLYCSLDTPKIKEELEKKWVGWDVDGGECGYIGLLSKIGMETSELMEKMGSVRSNDPMMSK